MTFEKIYPRLPLALQKLAVHLEGWRLQRSRFGRDFQATLQTVRARGRWSADELCAFRDQRLQQFVRHAVAHVPYYADLFAKLGLCADDIRTLDDLRQLPVLSKAEVAADPQRFLAQSLMQQKRIPVATSGTTGTAMAFQILLSAYQEQRAVWWRFRDRFGIDSDREPYMYFTGRTMVEASKPRPPFWRYNYPGRQLLLSGQHMHPGNADLFFDEMERCGYRWLHGYTSMLAVMAHLALQRNRRFKFKWVSLGGENVMPQQAEVIEAAFGARPIVHYGMVEQVANFSQCAHGVYHVDEDFAAVDFLPTGNDGNHLVLGTNLVNPLFPLIRYSAGDVVKLGQSCPCGLPGRIVERIDGQQEDYIIGKSGIVLTRFDYIFKKLPNVREAQIRQHRPGHMTVCIVRNPGYNADDERNLRTATFARTGGDVDVDIEYVDHLPRTASGKLRFVVSTVQHGGLTSLLEPSLSQQRAAA